MPSLFSTDSVVPRHRTNGPVFCDKPCKLFATVVYLCCGWVGSLALTVNYAQQSCGKEGHCFFPPPPRPPHGAPLGNILAHQNPPPFYSPFHCLSPRWLLLKATLCSYLLGRVLIRCFATTPGPAAQQPRRSGCGPACVAAGATRTRDRGPLEGPPSSPPIVGCPRTAAGWCSSPPPPP